jgi:hypothetical protein
MATGSWSCGARCCTYSPSQGVDLPAGSILAREKEAISTPERRLAVVFVLLELRPPGCAGVPLRLCEIVRDEDLPLPEVLALGERRVLRIRGCEGYAERAGLVRTRVRTPEALEPGPGGICWEESGQLLLVIPLRDTNDDNIVRNGSALALFLSSFERVELVCEVRPDGLNLILMAALLGLQPALDLGRELRRKLIEFLIKRCCN